MRIELVLCISVARNLRYGPTHGAGNEKSVRNVRPHAAWRCRSLHLRLRVHLLLKMHRRNECTLSELRGRTGASPPQVRTAWEVAVADQSHSRSAASAARA